MKFIIKVFLSCSLLFSCSQSTDKSKITDSQLPIKGTWKLFQGTLTEKGKSVTTDYTKNISFIKIINDTHFAFLQHDLNKGQDSTAVFVAGGGAYTLFGNQYIEHLEYCNGRQWEGKTFKFTITINNDTLIQNGREKVDNLGIDRLNVEKYVRIK